ncbi:hypothetical protein [Macrococcus capreoli]|uniref:hypothetical protein n=1 Tax=Macrococcus capreoli TaxID=2982690 RepID=UPI0021D573D0|nr:hypothetical protein [Macrococcus sp. TMW 2.2395]MCU7556588.1 hypothetical protein [Macrococcus sp. TMW 2.2395]
MPNVEYEVSKHAIQRYKERCGGRGKGDVLAFNAKKWCNEYIPQSECLGVYEDGHTHYRFKQMEIVVSKENVVITISFYTGVTQTLVEEVSDAVKTKIMRLLKPYKKAYKELQIEMHEAEIRRLKARNPKVQERIAEVITDINREIITVSNHIHDLETLAKTYNVEV